MPSARPFTASPPPKRRRRRPAVSCETCRSRKVRCDKNLPCGACVRARNSTQCTYREDSPPVGADTPIGPPAARPHRPGEGTEPRDHGIAGAATSPAAGLRDGGSRDRPPTTSYTDSGHGRPAQQTHSVALPAVTSIPPPRPRLRHVPDKTKLFGQTHWLHIAEKFPISGAMDPVEVEPSFPNTKAELLGLVEEAKYLRRAVKTQNSVKLEPPVTDLSATLPAKPQCEEALAECYLRTFEPLYRVLHLPTFWRDFDGVWDQDGSSQPSTAFLMKLSLVLAIGTTFYTPQDDAERDKLRRLAQTWIHSVQWLLTGPHDKVGNTIGGLQIFCLLFLAHQTTFNCAGPSAFTSAASLLRMAVAMGLHRNPAMFPALSPFQRESRNRLWASVLELTAQSCLTQGLPLGFTEADYDAPLPSNFDDADLDPEAKIQPPPSEGLTDSTLQILLAKSLPCRLRVIQILNDFRNQQEYETTLRLGEELRAACRDIARLFGEDAQPASPGRRQLAPTDFHRRFLDIHVRRFSLYLHRPFMLHARSDPRFYLARKLCVDASLVLLSHAEPAAGPDDDDDLARVSVVGRGLYKGALSFDAIVVLALEVVTQLQDEGPGGGGGGGRDPQDAMARAARAPLVDALRRLEPRLRAMTRAGDTSLKRYIFTAAYLAQIRAMEAGRSVRLALAEAGARAVGECCAVLRGRKEEGVTPPESALGAGDGLPSDMLPFDLGFADLTGFDWANANSLFFPEMNDAPQVPS